MNTSAFFYLSKHVKNVFACAFLTFAISAIQAETPIFEETFSDQKPGDQAHQLVNWQKHTGFPSESLTIQEDETNNLQLHLKASAISTLFSRDAFAIQTPYAVTFALTRHHDAGSWLRLTIQESGNLTNAYFFQFYARQIEVVRLAGEESERIGKVEFDLQDYPLGTPVQVRIQISTQKDGQTHVSLFLNEELLIEGNDPLTPLPSPLQLGLRAQENVEISVDDIRLLSLP